MHIIALYALIFVTKTRAMWVDWTWQLLVHSNMCTSRHFAPRNAKIIYSTTWRHTARDAPPDAFVHTDAFWWSWNGCWVFCACARGWPRDLDGGALLSVQTHARGLQCYAYCWKRTTNVRNRRAFSAAAGQCNGHQSGKYALRRVHKRTQLFSDVQTHRLTSECLFVVKVVA